MKIGILGYGYIGQAIASFLKKQGHSISVTIRSIQRQASLLKVMDEVCLITQPNDLIPFLKPLEILIVCVAPGPSDTYYSTYLETAQNVVASLALAPHLRQLIYTSSTSVYGEHGGDWVDENSLATPLNENGQILLDTENCYLQTSPSDLNTCIFRLGEIYGPGRMIEDRLKRSHQKKFPGNGNQFTNLSHQDDIVKAVDFAIRHELNGVYNLCSDLHVSRKEFYTLLCKQHNIPTIQWDEQITSPHGGNKRVSSKKLNQLGFNFLS